MNKINEIGNIPPNISLMAMGLKSLYTNIPNSERTTAVKTHTAIILRNRLQPE